MYCFANVNRGSHITHTPVVMQFMHTSVRRPFRSIAELKLEDEMRAARCKLQFYYYFSISF
jgi:hypothetical protein